MTRPLFCPVCWGTGADPEAPDRDCEECNGTGDDPRSNFPFDTREEANGER